MKNPLVGRSVLLSTNLEKKTNILFLSHSSALAGAERSLLALLQGLNRNRFEPLVIVPSRGLLYERIVSLGIRVVEYPIQRWIAFYTEFGWWHFKRCFGQLALRVRFVSHLIKKENIDIVYTNTITCIDGALAAKLCRIPHIWHIHEILQRNTSLKSYLPFFLISFFVKILSRNIIVVSKATQNGLMAKSNAVMRRKTKVVYNGFDTGLFLGRGLDINNGGRLLESLGLEKGTKLVVSIGALIEIKGQSDLIKAAAIVTKKFKQVAFVMIGGGDNEYLDKLKYLTRRMGLENKVFFLGFQENIIPFYSSIDILVSSSLVEALSRTLIEAMVAGKPVVATRTNGNEEIVVDGETGFLVSPKSPEDLADAIIKLLSDSDLANRMGKLGRLRAVQLFNLKRYIADIENIINEALEKKNVRI